jgi:hypothetical protein
MTASVLTQWSNFYIMTGSSAAALIGLMFVVITLVTDVERLRKSELGISAFSTPTVVHFGAALLVSAILSAPWHLLVYAALLIGLAGLSGVVYVLRLASIMRRVGEYEPDVEDWCWYTILPVIAYGTLLGGALMLPGAAFDALFALAGGVVLLIFAGIHNAWDIVTYIIVRGADEKPEPSKDDDAV